MQRILITLIAVGFCTSVAFAAPTMDEFYDNPDNQAGFDQATSQGTLQQAREQMVQRCEQEAARGGEAMDCACFSERLTKVSDKELFYESMLAFEQYQKMVAARQAGDEARVEALRKEAAERKGPMQEIGEACQQG